MDITQFFADVISQNEAKLRDYFCEDAVIRWHCTNEEFSADEYVRANCEYPSEWLGEMERVEEMGDTVIFAARVYPTDETSSHHVVGFMTLSGDKILTLDEYWADDGDAPAWRQAMTIGKPIRDSVI